MTRADKRLFIGAFMAGAAVWGAFALFNTEPWDTLYGVAALLALGLALGYAGDTFPALVGSLAGAALRRRRG